MREGEGENEGRERGAGKGKEGRKDGRVGDLRHGFRGDGRPCIGKLRSVPKVSIPKVG